MQVNTQGDAPNHHAPQPPIPTQTHLQLHKPLQQPPIVYMLVLGLAPPTISPPLATTPIHLKLQQGKGWHTMQPSMQHLKRIALWQQHQETIHAPHKLWVLSWLQELQAQGGVHGCF